MRGSLFHLPHHGGQPRAQRLKGDAEAEAQEERKDEGYRGAVHQRERNIRQFLGDEQADAKGRGHAGHGHEDIDDDAEPNQVPAEQRGERQEDGHTEEPVHMHRKIHWKRFFLRQSREQTVWNWMYS